MQAPRVTWWVADTPTASSGTHHLQAILSAARRHGEHLAVVVERQVVDGCGDAHERLHRGRRSRSAKRRRLRGRGLRAGAAVQVHDPTFRPAREQSRGEYCCKPCETCDGSGDNEPNRVVQTIRGHGHRRASVAPLIGVAREGAQRPQVPAVHLSVTAHGNEFRARRRERSGPNRSVHLDVGNPLWTRGRMSTVPAPSRRGLHAYLLRDG